MCNIYIYIYIYIYIHFSYFLITIFSLKIDETAIATKLHERQQHNLRMYQNFLANEQLENNVTGCKGK